MEEDLSIKKLIEIAFEARKYAYSPYSHFMVGAALVTKSGKMFKGCNVESAAYSPTNCAERTAFFKAISEGEREFESIVIVGGYESGSKTEKAYCAPCGVCRQVMMEFCKPDFKIVLAKSTVDFIECTLESLLPMGFGPANLQKNL